LLGVLGAMPGRSRKVGVTRVFLSLDGVLVHGDGAFVSRYLAKFDLVQPLPGCLRRLFAHGCFLTVRVW
jgi:hypothetical protein